MKRAKTPSYVLKLPLRCEPWQQDYLDKMFRVGGNLYNQLVEDRKKALAELEKTRAWRQVQQAIRDAFQKEDPDTELLKALYQQKQELLATYGFSDYAFQSRINKWRAHHKGLIKVHVAQKIASAVWSKFEDYFFGTGKEVRFKPWVEFLSMEGKSNATGIRFTVSALVVNKVSIPVFIPDAPYVQRALQGRVKYCRISRMPWHGKNQWLYSLQLVMEGELPEKELGSGRVGVDIGTQTIAAVGDLQVTLEELAPGANLPNEKLRRINRAMDRSRRASNPQMFTADGQIVPINRLPAECVRNGRRKWVESKHYKNLSQERRYLYAKLARIRRVQHNTLVNRLLTYGNEFYVEKMNFHGLAKKAKRGLNNKGREKRRKRFGKSIANKAPALFLTILEQKVVTSGGKFQRIDAWKAKASQYDHTDKAFHKKSLSKRWTSLQNGEKVQRDLYSAFLIQHTNETLDGFIQPAVEAAYPTFKVLHDLQIEQLTHIQTPCSTGVKGIA